ncbi:DedA family protein [Kitasatospora sp. NPDC008050]|uniref:DedA family protein n=1 Tax=Kitasatospora sp. NPDC008050 TaxID=3364021 RepID=UPI0036E1AAC8
MTVTEYVLLFLLVAISGFGLPGPGEASLIAAGTLAGEGKLNLWIVLGIGMTAWLGGSVAGFTVGFRQGRALLERPGWFAKKRRKLLVKGDEAFGRRTFTASVILPAFVSGVFRVRFALFMLGALTAGAVLLGIYAGIAYFLGPEIAERIGSAGTKAVFGVVLVVAIGLGIKAAVSKWRAGRRAR